MAKTASRMTDLGIEAPYFSLPDMVSGEMISLSEIKSDTATVVMFICNHCPFVKHVQRELVRLAKDYQPRGISFVAINSNDVEDYPEDSPKYMREVAHKLGYPFPYLFDETQEVARAYGAACTPDFFIFDKDLRLVYRGQLDDSRPNSNIPVTGSDVREALDCIMAGAAIPEPQYPSVGCSIKWRPSESYVSYGNG